MASVDWSGTYWVLLGNACRCGARTPLAFRFADARCSPRRTSETCRCAISVFHHGQRQCYLHVAHVTGGACIQWEEEKPQKSRASSGILYKMYRTSKLLHLVPLVSHCASAASSSWFPCPPFGIDSQPCQGPTLPTACQGPCVGQATRGLAIFAHVIPRDMHPSTRRPLLQQGRVSLEMPLRTSPRKEVRSNCRVSYALGFRVQNSGFRVQ